MAAGKEYEFSSLFDAMLDQDRKRLEQLYDGPAGDRRGPAARSGAAHAPLPRAARSTSDPRAALDDRFGERWRHEIVERRRDGGDMVVRCRLTVAGDGIDLVRSGRAPIDPVSPRPEIVASADGVPFSFRSDDVAGDSGAAEDAAGRAVMDALAKCVAAL